ncbi:MAG: hypothetical protein ACPGSD_03740 [Flavobacteriales bacterium]
MMTYRIPKFIIFFLFSVVFFSTGTLLAQTKVKTIDFKSKIKSPKISALLPFYNKEEDHTALFITHFSDIELLLLDKENNIQKHIQARKPRLGVSDVVGVSAKKNHYTIYLLNRVKDKLGVLLFDLENEETEKDILYIDLKREEKVFGQFSHNNAFYLISIFKNTSTIKLRKFKKGNEIAVEKFVFNNEDFPHFLAPNLFNCIYYNDPFFKPTQLYNPVVNSNKSDYFKLEDNNLYICSNTNTVVKIDLLDFSSKVTNFPSRYKQQGDNLKSTPFKNLVKHNKTKSDITNGHFFRVNLYKKEITLEMYHIETGKLILDTYLDIDNEYANYLELTPKEKSKRLETKINKAIRHGKLNISTYFANDLMHISIGKNASQYFWKTFDNALVDHNNPGNTHNTTVDFVGVFSEGKPNFQSTNFSTQLIFTTKEKNRVLDFAVDKTGSFVKTDSNLENHIYYKFYNTNDHLNFHRINALYNKGNKSTFIRLDEKTKTLEIYE